MRKICASWPFRSGVQELLRAFSASDIS